MLTKDLIRARVVKDNIHPRYIDAAAPELVALAGQLLAVYRPEQHPTRGEIEETLAPVINAARDPVVARGLNKLILDRCEFGHASAEDYPAHRRAIFAAGAALLREPGELDLADYRRRVLAAADGVAMDATGIYADLPENEELLSLRDLSPEDLLHRYNVALVQSLLLHARQLTVVIVEPDAAKLRRVFKYLKFFRLLAAITREPAPDRDPGGEGFRITVDGPASIFENTRKYGLQLASFFPALCDLRHWHIRADVSWRERPVTLRADHQLGLVSHYRNFSAYVPDEIRVFHDQFRDRAGAWEIVGQTPFIEVGDGTLLFPDLSFANAAGRIIHLELFHRWHAAQLEARLELLADQPELPLIIGVDRAVAERPDLAAALAASAWFARHGFVFRDFPGVPTVEKALELAAR